MKKIVIVISVIIIAIIGLFIFSFYKDLDSMVSKNDKISEFFINGGSYDNLCYHYVDTDKNTIIVGLKDDSKEEINNFKKKVLNYRFITFEKCVENNNYNTSYTFEDSEDNYNKLGSIDGVGIYSKYKVNNYNDKELINAFQDKDTSISELLRSMDRFKDNYYISDAYNNGRVFVSYCNNNLYISYEFDSEICSK